MIKIKLRRNLLYLLVYYISASARISIDSIMKYVFHIYPSFIFLYLIILGKIFGGLIIMLYQFNYWSKKRLIKYFNIPVITGYNKLIGDGKFKIASLIFLAAFFDLFVYITNIYNFKYICLNFPSSYNSRLSSIQTISSSLLCYFALKIKIKKHHKLSLIIIAICLILIFIIELYYKYMKPVLPIFPALLLICFTLICDTFNNCIEKYLVDTNFINPFMILMLEGIIEAIITTVISIVKTDFQKEVLKYFMTESTGQLVIIIILLCIYFLLSIVVTVYQIYCNVIYSPMARSFINYLLNPLYYLIFFFIKNDFNNNYFYFIFYEITSIIIDFFGCVYNEFIIIYACNLEFDTIDEIAERAKSIENIPIESNQENEYSSDSHKENFSDNKSIEVDYEDYKFMI